MTLIRWNPFEELSRIQREMDTLFTRSFGGGLLSTPRLTEASWTPTVDVLTRGEDMIVRVELPGVKAEDVDISIRDNVLTVSGERKHEEKVEEKDYVRMESSYGKFERSFTLPEGVDTDAITATYENGVLEITVPKAAEVEAPKKVKIEIGSGEKKGLLRGKKAS